LSEPIPVTLLTGFLGAGKTTLLNHILASAIGQRILVIENEFGPVSVDTELLICDRANVIEMTSGCLCCTIRGDLTRHLTDILRRRDASELAFDRLIIETTGLADPSPVAGTFFADPAVAAGYLLDGVLVVVDAVHAQRQFDEHPVTQKQVGFADRLLISKSDLVDAAQLDALSDRLSAMNPAAQQFISERGAIAIDDLLDIRGFNLREPPPEAGAAESAQPSYRHATQRRTGQAAARHEDEIAAILLEHDGPMDMDRVSAFMQGLLDTLGEQLLRYKGTLAIHGEPCRLIFQGVHRLAGFDFGSAWQPGEAPRSRIVLIGRRLPAEQLQAGFRTASALRLPA
jgi:G3E family GTPase